MWTSERAGDIRFNKLRSERQVVGPNIRLQIRWKMEGLAHKLLFLLVGLKYLSWLYNTVQWTNILTDLVALSLTDGEDQL